ncbi:MAG: hypothetical protein WDZ48_06725 [Pirellulales bacterium]
MMVASGAYYALEQWIDSRSRTPDEGSQWKKPELTSWTPFNPMPIPGGFGGESRFFPNTDSASAKKLSASAA